ncbi:MAG: rhomboid family intramembrane serine protease [Solirubrobacterales bacterium]
MATCYRHPGRETNVSCANCGRPICPDCMTSTPVGMRCPECARQRTQVKNPFGAATRTDAPATYSLIALCVAAFVAEVASGAELFTGGVAGSVMIDGGVLGFGVTTTGPVGVAEGEIYRVVTGAFLHAGILHLGLNMFILYLLGSILEPGIGTPRFIGVYAVSVLAGSFGALLLDPLELTVGASGGVFGLMGATFLIARGRGLDHIASQIGFLVVINLVFTFSLSGISVGGHIGGLVGGGLAGLMIANLEQRSVPNARALEFGAMIAICAIAVAGAMIAAEESVPAGFG